jgi:precorrin-2 dehydrogenase/sirohydrochlorin ferrochelatase
MGYLPIFVDLRGRQCIVIGGGDSAEAKVRALLDAGAIVTVVSRDAANEIKSRAAAGEISYLAREYERGDLHGKWLAYIANTSDEVVRHAADEARELGILLNVVDDPQSSIFISPAILRRGDLQIAITTGGSSPAIAQMLRQRLEQWIGPEYGPVLEIMRRARQFLRPREPDQHVRAKVMKSLAAALLDSVERLDQQHVDQVLRLHLNADMAELGLDLKNGLTRRGGAVRRNG